MCKILLIQSFLFLSTSYCKIWIFLRAPIICSSLPYHYYIGTITWIKNSWYRPKEKTFSFCKNHFKSSAFQFMWIKKFLPKLFEFWSHFEIISILDFIFYLFGKCGTDCMQSVSWWKRLANSARKVCLTYEQDLSTYKWVCIPYMIYWIYLLKQLIFFYVSSKCFDDKFSV